MLIFFLNKKLEKQCYNHRDATKTLGALAAKKLKSRLSDLQSALSVSELSVGKPHPLKGKRHGQFSLTLHRGCRLVFEAADVPLSPSLKKDDDINWDEVRAVRIVYIGDYHD